MSMPSILSEPTGEWGDISRVEAWAGEIRVNLIRLLAIAVFYSRHLVQVYYAGPDDPVRGAYHMQVTWLAILWAGIGLVLHIWLTRRYFPPTLKFATVLIDAGMITMLCMLAGGPKSLLILLFFLVIAMAPLRLSLPVVYLATACAIGGYLVVLANYAWYQIGFKTYYSTEGAAFRIPRSNEAIIVLALLTAGFIAGQSVRQARRIAARYPVVVDEKLQG
jgi:hypothetical protein